MIFNLFVTTLLNEPRNRPLTLSAPHVQQNCNSLAGESPVPVAVNNNESESGDGG